MSGTMAEGSIMAERGTIATAKGAAPAAPRCSLSAPEFCRHRAAAS